MNEIVSVEIITTKILVIRSRRVMLDRDLAKLYGVETKQLVRQVKRNIERFPQDFMYQLTRQEVINLRFQIGTSRWTAEGIFLMNLSQFVISSSIKHAPNVFAFTQEGVAILKL